MAIMCIAGLAANAPAQRVTQADINARKEKEREIEAAEEEKRKRKILARNDATQNVQLSARTLSLWTIRWWRM